MTELLAKAFVVAGSLPEALQDEIAATILADIEDEARWAESFARSSDRLAELAAEAADEVRGRRAMSRDT
jgi:hypothetical protein